MPKQEPLAWFPFYAHEFSNSGTVNAMEGCQVGIYILLLCQQWIDGSLPSLPEDAARAIGRRTPEEVGAVREVLNACFVIKGCRAVNLKLQKIRRNQQQIFKVRSRKARHAAHVKHQKDRESQRALKGLLQACSPHAIEIRLDQKKEEETSESQKTLQSSSSSIVKKQSRKKNPLPLSDDEFLIILKSNPAYKHIDFDVELGRMDAWLLTPKAHGRQKTRQFIVRWLNKIDKPMQAENGKPAWRTT